MSHTHKHMYLCTHPQTCTNIHISRCIWLISLYPTRINVALRTHPFNPTEPQSSVDPTPSYTNTHTHVYTHTLVPSSSPSASKPFQKPGGHPVTQSQSELSRWTHIDNLLIHTHHLCYTASVTTVIATGESLRFEWVIHQKTLHHCTL